MSPDAYREPLARYAPPGSSTMLVSVGTVVQNVFSGSATAGLDVACTVRPLLRCSGRTITAPPAVAGFGTDACRGADAPMHVRRGAARHRVRAWSVRWIRLLVYTQERGTVRTNQTTIETTAKIASAMGKGWRHRCGTRIIDGPDGARIRVNESFQKPGQICIDGLDDQDSSFTGRRWCDADGQLLKTRIYQAASKSADVAARDILRRLVPGYLRVLAQQRQADEQRRAKAAAGLAVLAPLMAVIGTTTLEELDQRSLHWAYGTHPRETAEVMMCDDDTQVSMWLRRLSPALATHLLAAVRDFYQVPDSQTGAGDGI